LSGPGRHRCGVPPGTSRRTRPNRALTSATLSSGLRPSLRRPVATASVSSSTSA
jgi:hypothetical protein